MDKRCVGKGPGRRADTYSAETAAWVLLHGAIAAGAVTVRRGASAWGAACAEP